MIFICFAQAQILENQKVPEFSLQNQFDRPVQLGEDTKYLVLAFAKDSAHSLRAFFDQKGEMFLNKHRMMFLADVSAMPSIIRWFVLDKLDVHKYPIVLIEDDEISQKFQPDQKFKDKIMLLSLENKVIKKIEYFNTPEKMEENIIK